jgi:hypothetical protein
MNKTALNLIPIIFLSLQFSLTVAVASDLSPSDDRHMQNVTRITFEGDNGEAYFSNVFRH